MELMKNYRIPDTDGLAKLTLPIDCNFKKYRSLLHFIFLNRKHYILKEKEVSVEWDYLKNKSGEVSQMSTNVSFCYKQWKRTWGNISKDDIFLIDVKEMLKTKDIIEFLSRTVPCGLTRHFRDMRRFAANMKKLLEKLEKKIRDGYAEQSDLTKHESLKAWIDNLPNTTAKSFMIPEILYDTVQECAKADIDYKTYVDKILKGKSPSQVLRPYLWAAICEVFYRTRVTLQKYKPHECIDEAMKKIESKSAAASKAEAKHGPQNSKQVIANQNINDNPRPNQATANEPPLPPPPPPRFEETRSEQRNRSVSDRDNINKTSDAGRAPRSDVPNIRLDHIEQRGSRSWPQGPINDRTQGHIPCNYGNSSISTARTFEDNLLKHRMHSSGYQQFNRPRSSSQDVHNQGFSLTIPHGAQVNLEISVRNESNQQTPPVVNHSNISRNPFVPSANKFSKWDIEASPKRPRWSSDQSRPPSYHNNNNNNDSYH